MELVSFIKNLKHELLNETYFFDNTILIVIDGMGYHQIKNLYPCEKLTTCIPSSTVPATTLLRTALSPTESQLFGWSQYYEQTDEIIEVFSNQNILTGQQSKLETSPIQSVQILVEQIKQKTKYNAYEIMQHFNQPDSLSDWCKRILNISVLPEKKYIYAYWYQLDSIAHKYGIGSPEYLSCLNDILDALKQMLSDLPKNTRVFITADHGLINTTPIYIDDYPQLLTMLSMPIFLEPRYVGFKIKDEYKNKFENQFNIPDFRLIRSNHSRTGDFIAVATGKYALYQQNITTPNRAEHGSITQLEQDIPLIRINIK